MTWLFTVCGLVVPLFVNRYAEAKELGENVNTTRIGISKQLTTNKSCKLSL